MFDLDVYPSILKRLAIGDAVSLLSASRHPFYSRYLWLEALRNRLAAAGLIALPKGKAITSPSDSELRIAAFKTVAICNRWAQPHVDFTYLYSFSTQAICAPERLQFLFNIPGANLALFFFHKKSVELGLTCLDLSTGNELCSGVVIAGVILGYDFHDTPKIREIGTFYGDGEVSFAFFSEIYEDDLVDSHQWQIHVVQLVYGKGSEAAMSIRNVISIEKDTDVICDSQDVQVHFDGKTVVFAVFSSDSELYFGSHAISFDSNAIEKCLLQSIRCTSSVDEDDKFSLTISSSIYRNGVLNIIVLDHNDDSVYLGFVEIEDPETVELSRVPLDVGREWSYLSSAELSYSGFGLCILTLKDASHLALVVDENGELSIDSTVAEAVWSEHVDDDAPPGRTWLEFPANGTSSIFRFNGSPPHITLLTPRLDAGRSCLWSMHVLKVPPKVGALFDNEELNNVEIDECTGRLIVTSKDSMVYIVSYL